MGAPMPTPPFSSTTIPAPTPLNVQFSNVTPPTCILLSDILADISPPSILPNTILVSDSGRNLYRNLPVALSETVTIPAAEIDTSVIGLSDGTFFFISNIGLPLYSRTTLKEGGLPGSRIKYRPLNA